MTEKKYSMANRMSYSIELAKEICDAIAASPKGLKAICKEHEHFPSHSTVYEWLNLHEEFADFYAKAKRKQIEVFMSDLIDVCRDTSNDFFIDESTGRKIANPSSVPRSRLEIDTKKWLASKLAPKLYGGSLTADEVTVDTADMKRRKEELDEKNKKDY